MMLVFLCSFLTYTPFINKQKSFLLTSFFFLLAPFQKINHGGWQCIAPRKNKVRVAVIEAFHPVCRVNYQAHRCYLLTGEESLS